MTRILLILAFFGELCVNRCAAQTTNSAAGVPVSGPITFPFAEARDLDFAHFRGRATLSVENPVVGEAKLLSFEIRFFNFGQGNDFYNPFFNPLVSPPARLALYDANHNYIDDLFLLYAGSHAGPSWDDWTFIPGGGSVGMTMQINPNHWGRHLPPGDYYLQVIYFKAFVGLGTKWEDIGPNEEAKRSQLKDFLAHFDDTELFRSNPVKFTLTGQ